jgi:hypothetical protein
MLQFGFELRTSGDIEGEGDVVGIKIIVVYGVLWLGEAHTFVSLNNLSILSIYSFNSF